MRAPSFPKALRDSLIALPNDVAQHGVSAQKWGQWWKCEDAGHQGVSATLIMKKSSKYQSVIKIKTVLLLNGTGLLETQVRQNSRIAWFDSRLLCLEKKNRKCVRARVWVCYCVSLNDRAIVLPLILCYRVNPVVHLIYSDQKCEGPGLSANGKQCAPTQ